MCPQCKNTRFVIVEKNTTAVTLIADFENDTHTPPAVTTAIHETLLICTQCGYTKSSITTIEPSILEREELRQTAYDVEALREMLE